MLSWPVNVDYEVTCAGSTQVKEQGVQLEAIRDVE